jgi:hypothetical protein
MKKFGLFILLVLLGVSSTYAITIDSVSTTPSEIAPGEVSNINFEIENNGETDIQDISIILDLTSSPFAPYLSSTEFNIDELKDGKTKSASFEVKALNNADSGIYKIPLKITYTENGQTKERSSLISLSINSEPIISGNIEEGLLLNGKENSISVKIINKGLSSIKFLEVEIDKSSYYTILSPENVYIGDLDSNDFDSADFKIYFKENSPTNIKIPIVLKYKDLLNNEYEKTLNLDAKVYSQEQAIQLGLIQKNNTVIYVVIAVILIIIYLVYRRIRKAMKREKEKEE